MSSRTINIIDALYGNEMRPSRRSRFFRWLFRRRVKRVRSQLRMREERVLALYRQRSEMLTKGRIAIFLGICLGFVFLIISVVYYNRLTSYEQDVFMEYAKIDSLLQRRRDISVNLARLVRDYAIHERSIFKHVSDIRAISIENDKTKPKVEVDALIGSNAQNTPSVTADTPNTTPKTPSADAAGDRTVFDDILSILDGSSTGDVPLENKLARLMAVAESYPDLKLSENFRNFMEALVETEKELSERRMKYAEVVNVYTTQFRTFPGKVFAFVYRFKPVSYFTADEEARRFSPVEY